MQESKKIDASICFKSSMIYYQILRGLNDSVFCGESSFDGYMVYRSDRCQIKSGKLDGGGALIAVNTDSFKSFRITTTVEAFDQLFVRVFNHSTNILNWAVYLYADTTAEHYKLHADTVEQTTSGHQQADFVIFGEYNLPNISWSNYPLSCNSKIGYRHRNCTTASANSEDFGSLGLNQIHPSLVPDKDNSLDLVFTNIEILSFQAPVEILRDVDPPHPPAILNLSIHHSKEDPSECTYYDFKNADYAIINNK